MRSCLWLSALVRHGDDEDRAGCLLDDLGGDGAEEEIADGAGAASADDDELRLQLLGEFEGLRGWLADAEGGLEGDAGGDFGSVVAVDGLVEGGLGLFVDVSDLIDVGFSELRVRLGEDMEQRELAAGPGGGDGDGLVEGGVGVVGEVGAVQDA